MDVLHIVERINELFNVTNKEIYSSESGITYHADKKVKKLGYCVNLTLLQLPNFVFQLNEGHQLL